MVQYDKVKNVVKLKHSKHNAHYARPLESLKSATAKCENKRKLFFVRYKKRSRIVKNNKKGATKRIFLVLLQDKKNTKWNKYFKTPLHGKSDIKTATMMKNSATASSSSPCPSFPEAMIPKNISHGP